MTTADPRIDWRSTSVPGARYLSGSTVYDEALVAGRWVTRYWNVNGQIWPEMHLAGRQWTADQPADAFDLAVNGQSLGGAWVWEGAALTADPGSAPRTGDNTASRPVSHGVVRLAAPAHGVGVDLHTRVDGGPFFIRWLEIANTGERPFAITAVAPWAGALWSHRFEEHLPPGQRTPFELGWAHQFEWGREGDFWFEDLAAGVTRIDGGRKGRSGWGRPAFWARNRCNGQTVVAELAWGGSYRLDLDCRLRDEEWGGNHLQPATRHGELFFRVGLAGHDAALRVIDPGERVATPAVHLAFFHADVDRIVQATHDHVRHVVMPPPVAGRHVEIEANHRGYLCDRESTPAILADADVAAAVGAEMYVVDAGWYGNEPNQWGANVGDWHDGPWMAAGGGLRAVSDHAHQLGLRFGLWVEIEAAGAHSDLRRQHPEWLLRRDGEPIAGGRALDLTQPEVARWVESEIARLIDTYALDMYRIDHNHCLTPAGNRDYRGFREDLTWRYYEALYGIFDRLRSRFPAVVFQNCAGGGGRLDWGTLARFHNTELSDWMRLPRGVQILNGVTLSLPPEVLLRTFGTETGEHALDGDIDAQLRLCCCRPIFRGIAPTLDELSPYLHQRITHFLDLYRRWVRPTMVDGLVFHHTPFTPLAAKAPWCVLEYARRDRSVSVAMLFRTGGRFDDDADAPWVFRPRGLDPGRTYAVVADNSGGRHQASGQQLATDGVRVCLGRPLASEMLIFTAEDGRDAT